MLRFIDWLRNNRSINLAILFSYFLLVVLPHEIVGRFIMNDIFGDLSRSILNSTVLAVSMIGLSLFLYLLARNLINGKQRRSKLIYLFVTLVLIVIVYNTLFVLATESAHFPQYALMAILLFPLTLNYNSTLFGATILGSLDEAYQYFYLNPTATGYLDFNDVVTDLLGAVLGLLLIWFCEIKSIVHSKPWYKSNALLFGAGIKLATGFLILIGTVSIYPNEDGTMASITLMKKVPPSFWSYDKVGELYFHIMHPLEGIIVIIILLGIYRNLGRN